MTSTLPSDHVSDPHPKYPTLFEPWRIRHTEIANRIVFPPTCPSWVNNPWDGVFTDMARAYYEERAKGGVGLIIIGATHVHPHSLMAPLMTPQLFDDRNIGPLSDIVAACGKYGTKVAIQLWHSGLRGMPTYKQDPAYDFDAAWHTVSPSQVPLGEFPGSSTPKELEEHEIEEIIDSYAAAARRAADAGLHGVEFHLSHGYLGWQFLSPLYNKRTDRWGGSYENRLRFAVECMTRMRAAIGDDVFMGYRINSTSFWPGDLEIDDVKQIVADLEQRTDVDYVNVSAGVHHAFIHTPMEFEPGWEKGYSKAIKQVSNKPVLLVGRISTPDVAERLLVEEAGDAICMARQLFADPEWVNKARGGQEEDIRRCVAANFCWRSVSRGGRVQCVYNPTVGREAAWGAGTLHQVGARKRILIIGGGPSGLEYARVSAARGHDVTVLEAEDDTGGHARLQSLLPGRAEYGNIATWLTRQAEKNGAKLHRGRQVDEDNLDAVLDEFAPDHVVVATGAVNRRDGFQGWTGDPIPGWDTGNCISWVDYVTGAATPTGHVLVVDDVCDAVAPLAAVGIADAGADSVTLLSRWPMSGMDTILDVYLEWLLPKLYRSGVIMLNDHFIRSIDGPVVKAFNVHHEEAVRELRADTVVMVTGRTSVNGLKPLIAARGVSVEALGDAVAPRGTYEAVFEGHRQARLV